MKDFEIISHTADLEICVYGRNEKELFKNALIGMFQVIKPKAQNCFYKNEKLFCAQLPINHKIEIKSEEIELLLIDFLSQALYLSDTNNEAYLDVEIEKITDKYLCATLKGIKIEGFNIEIKAVTYHNLKITKENEILKTHIVFDI